MRYYSLSEVLHDINEVELIDVKVPDLDLEVKVPDLRFVKLYSDFYADKEKKGDFKQRFARYAIACRSIPLDKDPSPDKKVTFYSYTTKNGSPFEAFMQAEFDDYDQALDFLNLGRLHKVMLYLHQTSEFQYLVRNLH